MTLSNMNRRLLFLNLDMDLPLNIFTMFVANSFDSSYNLRNTATDLTLPKEICSNGQKDFSYKGMHIAPSLLKTL